MIISQTPLRMSFVEGGSTRRLFSETMAARRSARRSTATSTFWSIQSSILASALRIRRPRYAIASTWSTQPCAKPCACSPNYIQIPRLLRWPTRHPAHGLGPSSALKARLLNYSVRVQGMNASKGVSAPKRAVRSKSMCSNSRSVNRISSRSAYGGINPIRFNPDDTVDVEPVTCPIRSRLILSAALLCSTPA